MAYSNEPWTPGTIPVTSKAFKRMVARARLDNRRERMAMVCWSYSRDRVVERRELACEDEMQKLERYARAKLQKHRAAETKRQPLRMAS